MNNGHASEPFLLERGVRQGCPLSGMLFVIAIEVLAQKIRRSKMIKGIEIEYNGSQEIKLSQYADDTTALLSDSESVMQLFELLGLFERCSGLKINEILPQNDFSFSLGMIFHINRVAFFPITSPRFQDNLMCNLIVRASHFQST